jgi:hypothetical protein
VLFGADQRWMTTILFSHGLARIEALSGAPCTCVRPRPASLNRAADGRHGLYTLLATVAAEWLKRKQGAVGWPLGMHLVPNELALSYDDDPPKRPPELKPYITEYMNDDAILKHVCRIVGSFLVTFDDDFRDWFYQLKLMAGCYWQVGFIMLELQKLASELPELRFIVEKVLGQGTTPGSNWGSSVVFSQKWCSFFPYAFKCILMHSNAFSTISLHSIPLHSSPAAWHCILLHFDAFTYVAFWYWCICLPSYAFSMLHLVQGAFVCIQMHPFLDAFS